jgi:3-deoxy-D-arabino-heptulosonate 7-phosphate (DAHP) synthase
MELVQDTLKQLIKESKQSETYILNLTKEIEQRLIFEGCSVDNPKFLQYLVRRLRKKLKVEESKVYMTFRQFFKEK